MAEDAQHSAAAAGEVAAVEQQSEVQGDATTNDAPVAVGEVQVVAGDADQQQQYAYDQQQQQQQQQQNASHPLSADLERIKIFVGNFPPHITDLDLGAMCGQFAQIAGGVAGSDVCRAMRACAHSRCRSGCTDGQSHWYEQRIRFRIRQWQGFGGQLD